MNTSSPLLQGLNPNAIVPQIEEHDEDDRPSLTFMNFSGDITVTWEESQHEMMKKLIEKKIAEGYTFFILKNRTSKIMNKLVGKKTVKLEKPEDLDGAESLTIPTGAVKDFVAALDDPSVAEAILKGTAKLSKPAKREKTGKAVASKDAEEIARSKAVVARPVTGG